MLKTTLIHPQILHALGRAGHGSKILISDGNYPHATARGPNAELVFLNLSPGMLGVVDILKTLLTSIPVEAANVMATNKTGPYVMDSDPPIWTDFRQFLGDVELATVERFTFYDLARGPDVCLTIASAEQQIYANLLLTIGVVK